MRGLVQMCVSVQRELWYILGLCVCVCVSLSTTNPMLQVTTQLMSDIKQLQVLQMVIFVK